MKSSLKQMPSRRTSLVYYLKNFTTYDYDTYFKESERAYRKVGLTLTRTYDESKADVIVHKTFNKDMRRIYPSVANSQLSVTDRGVFPMQIHLSGENWTAVPYHLGSEYPSLKPYRIALISHEFAHAFGHDHVSCACVGCKSDVRQQPSRSLGGCLPTTEVVFNKQSPHSNVNF